MNTKEKLIESYLNNKATAKPSSKAEIDASFNKKYL
jgi:hypothetical protein